MIRRFLPNKYLALVLAASLGITGLSTAPARADPDPVATVIFGVAAIAALGHILKKEDRGKVHVYQQRSTPFPEYRKHHKRHHWNKRDHRRWDRHDRRYNRFDRERRRDHTRRDDRHRDHTRRDDRRHYGNPRHDR
ncbi:hypothetical protein SAMN04490248_11434 [Salinihabitans flavidus]|uniref:Uncharacterized protein n=1 Tax=Salinihabitans flavidus TaxID=569882 RepID=A0A1H8T3I8_9RHOB|nr:hypothetical protein [Salinihabitans flavidus]SEO85649.1 hypothetical protein SAMN04490248_11434 [Salinihabitans flavidus]